jgi:hypothetical protein
MNRPTAELVRDTYGRDARDRRDEAREPTTDGARAALESFYHAFNNRSLDVLDAVWAPGELVSLNNPLGGIVRGLGEIRGVYRRIFAGPARVWVELHDVVEYVDATSIVFAGRERGEFARDGRTPVPLAIRTSRFFQYLGPELGWRQVHHHGSIDDAEALDRYQRAVRGA